MFKLNRVAATALSLILAQLALPAAAQNWQPEGYHYEYNAGPAAAGDSAAEIINLYAEQPENKFISDSLSPVQKFRYTFGAMMLRTNFAPNSIKIFAIGQDAVDDAELVKLPGTGTGYSTRVQNIANFHGVDTSIATSNASFQTIKGQYGSFDHPYVEKGVNGKLEIKQSKFIDNYLWTIFNGKSSPIVTHREKAWEWQIKNNMKSLRLIILFGGASQDAFAEFLLKRGFKVPTRLLPSRLAKIQVPESKLEYSGGNNEFPVLQTKDGKDLYAKLLGRRLDYKKLEDQTAAITALKNAGQSAIDMMAFNGGGVRGSGILTAAQLGGYDLTKVKNQNGTQTFSLKGLRLSDGTIIDKDIAFVGSPHPTSLSTNAQQASATVTALFEKVKPFIGGNNAIEPDLKADGTPMVNSYARGEAFQYGRAFLPRRVVPFGAPDSILRPKASADRLGPQVLVSEPPSKQDLRAAGVRNLEEIFDAAAIEAAKNVQPVEALNENDLWAQHSRQDSTRELADPGPGAEMAKLMVENLDRSVLPSSKAPVLGFFAHYRGTFENPKALIMYDSLDLEDRNTFRAATGARGQLLNGLMRDLGLELNQLVLTTAPVDMTGATAAELETVRKGTEGYREAVLAKVLAGSSLQVIFTDGSMAKSETSRILRKLRRSDIPVINVDRNSDRGIVLAGTEAKSVLNLRNARISGNPAGIPIQHLPWNSRDWERVTSGTVIEAKGAFKGKSYAIVTPNFVAQQNARPLSSTSQAVEAMKRDLQIMSIPLANDRFRGSQR
jgi:hypothetical protein